MLVTLSVQDNTRRVVGSANCVRKHSSANQNMHVSTVAMPKCSWHDHGPTLKVEAYHVNCNPCGHHSPVWHLAATATWCGC